MKRSLQSYEDFEAGETGEILEDEIVTITKTQSQWEDEEYEDDTDIDTTLLQKVALPVGKFDENFKEGDTPQSGDQYLCLVRHQRLGLPSVLMESKVASSSGVPTAVVSTGKSLKEILKEFNDDFNQASASIIQVDKKWADDFFSLFEESKRKFYEQLELESESKNKNYSKEGDSDTQFDPLNLGINDKAAWLHHLYGHVIKLSDDKDEINEKNVEYITPKTTLTKIISPTFKVLALFRNNQELVLKLLNYHRAWLAESSLKDSFITNESGRNLILTWLHALLMCLDEKLTSNEIAGLRLFARTLSVLSSTNHTHRKEIDEIILIISKSWHQSDLIKF